jgi:hypothetical protein
MIVLVRRVLLAGVRIALLLAIVFGIARDARADGPLDPKSVPEPLKPWTAWALRGKEDALCPTLHGVSGGAPQCAWPARLALSLDETRGSFTQTWHVDARRWVPLPGDDKRWPLDATVDGKRTVVVSRGGAPSVELPPGDHVVRGTFAWDSLPESLQVPAETALLSLTLRGKTVEQPNRDAGGTVWLNKTLSAEEGERLDFVVHRRIVDEVPLLLTTRIVMNVAGRNREVVLGRALPSGFVPMALESQLPARVEPDTRLRVQVRPGTWTIELVARSEGPITELKRPEPDGPWREGEEVWVFDARTNLRLVDVQGVLAIDPQQTSLPDEWKRLPAFPLAVGDTLELVEKRRGDADPASDQLTLDRTLWLDFDGRGLTASDTLTGKLRRASRLEMLPPTVLGRVAIGGKDQFITHLEGDAGKTGIELRQGDLTVSADSRIEAQASNLPAVGWNHDFHAVSGRLNLPPGYRLVHAWGVDEVGSSWMKHWTLLELFLVLILSIASFRLFGPKWGALALVTLVLAFPESGAPKYILVFVLGAEALVRVVEKAARGAGPEGPSRALLRMRRLAGVLRGAFAVILVLVTVPFLVEHVRHGLFPALAAPETSGFFALGDQGEMAMGALAEAPRQAAAAADPAPAIEEPTPESTVLEARAEKEDDDGKDSEDEVSQDAQQKIVAGKKAAPRGWGSGSASPLPSKYRQFNANVYDPTSMVQTGPGRPRWQFTQIPLRWSGPVERDQRLHLFLLSPATNGLLAIVRALLVLLLVLRLLPVKPRRTGGVLSFVTAAFALALLLAPGAANAQTVPPKEVLDDLAARLLEKPQCSPSCASSSRLLIEARPGALRLRMEIEASAATAVPLPTSAQWSPETVLLDGKPGTALLRTSDGKVWLAVEKGWHQASVEGRLPDRELVQLSLPLKPHRVETQTEGWRVEGIHEDGLADDNVQLTRIRGEGASGGGALEPGVLPPFVLVERTILIGLDWQVATRVVRLSPVGSAVVLEVPLLKGESVTTADVRVVAGKAQLNMPPQATEVSWTSVLDQRSPVVLTAPKTGAWTELWRLDSSPIWHVEVTGIPVVHAEPGAALPEWRPWPGESATLDVGRPAGVVGRTLTIDETSYEVRPGLRATDATLTMQIRSSRGAQHALTLPDGAELESVAINGVTSPIRQDGRRVVVPVSPGSQSVVLTWRTPTGMGALFRAPEVDLGAPSVNATTSIVVPEGRWVLALKGPRLGPVVLFWSLLAVLLVVSLAIGAMRKTPLRSWQWMLLAIGLSQVHVVAAAFVVAWLHVLAWREHETELRVTAFNLRQVAIAGMTAIALVVLLVAVEQGLLGDPDMQVQGNGSSYGHLRWFSDQSAGTLPQPLVVSAPMLIYRVAMLAWALWLALSLLAWLRWGFKAFGAGGFWRRRPPPPPPPADLPHRMPPQDPAGPPFAGPPGPAAPPGNVPT